MPPFFESWRAMFWQVLLIGFLDGIISIVGIQNLIMWGWMLSTIFGIILWMLHLGVYWLLAWRRENDWKVRFSDNLVHPEL